jgi:hypothetical protein
MVNEARQERRIGYRNSDGMTWSDTTQRRISEPWCNVVLWHRVRRKRCAISSLPLQSRGRSARRPSGGTTRCTRRPGPATDGNARLRRRSSRTKSKTSSLGIELRLQVPSDGAINTSANVLHGVVLDISIGRALRRISNGLAFRKAIGSTLTTTTTALTRHLQRKIASNPRVRKIRYISYSRKKKKKNT